MESNLIEYVVKEGDTIESIGRELNVGVESIRKLNRIEGEVKFGDVIKISRNVFVDPKVADVVTVAAGTLLCLLLEKYQSMKKEKGEKDIVVSDLRQQLLTESFFVNHS